VGTVKSVTRTNPRSGGKRVELACLDGKPAGDVQGGILAIVNIESVIIINETYIIQARCVYIVHMN
jgi:hypothetical protein